MKRVLITGASSGLGEGLALAYGKEGALVGLVARREAKLKEVAQQVRAVGGKALVLPADVRETSSMQRVISNFHKTAGGIDLVIANAGIGEGGDDKRFDATSAARVFEVNVIGLSNTLLPCANLMREQGSGSLVGIASVAGFRALPGSLSYSSSKAAVITLMEGLAMDLAGTQVHAMSICPGFIRTPLTDKNDFTMPFLLECEDACLRMKSAIDSGRARYTFPLPMALAASLLRVAPLWLLRKSLPLLTSKPRSSHPPIR